MLRPGLLSALIFTLTCLGLQAQTDSIVFYNGNYITGELESMNRGVFVFSTDYSDDDFTIEWDKIREIYTTTVLIVSLSDGTEHKATLTSTDSGRVEMLYPEGGSLQVKQDEIVELNPIGSKFMDRVSANWDLGYTYSKSSKNNQFNARTFVGYEAEKWNTDLSFNSMYSDQEGVDPTRILNGTWNIRYHLPARLFLILTVDMLSDSEQKLDFRNNAQGGAGAHIIRSNKAYWSAKAGLNRNLERYTDPANDRSSWEAYAGTEVNLYDIGDLNFLTSVILYPGLTQSGRWRSDIRFDIKYDLPMDFYISSGFTLNWDNMPVEGAQSTNLIFLAGFGWEW